MSTVICPQCGAEVEDSPNKLRGHIGGIHKTKLSVFFQKYPDFICCLAPEPRLPAPPEPEAPQEVVPPEVIEEGDLLAGLTASEREWFNDNFEIFFQQVDRDPALVEMVHSLLFDMLRLQKLRVEQREKDKQKEWSKAKSLEDIIKATQERISDTMDSLGISREKKLKHKVAIKTTPAALISGYVDEIERMSSEQQETMRLEEQRVLDVIRTRVEKIIIKRAPDLTQEQEDSNNDAPLDVDAIVSGKDYPF